MQTRVIAEITSKRLKDLRQSHGYSQEHLGEYLKQTRQTYARYEKGEKTPDLTDIFRLLELYQIPLEEFLSAYAGFLDIPDGDKRKMLVLTAEEYCLFQNLEMTDDAYRKFIIQAVLEHLYYQQSHRKEHE